MAVTPNLDHRMPQHIDVFEHIQECARKNLCCVWECGKPADIQRDDPVPGVTLPYVVPFCVEHANGYIAANQAAKSGELPEGLEPRNVRY